MINKLSLSCAGMYLLGQLLLLFWFTVPQLKEKCRVANKKFYWKEWWNCDKEMVIGNAIFGVILILLIDVAVKKWGNGFADYAKWYFVLAGAFGPTIVQEKWGSFKKSIMGLIDIKANIADTVMGSAVQNRKEAIVTGSDKLNEDVTKSPKP